MKTSIINTLAALCTVCLWAATTNAAIVSGPIVNPLNGHRYYLLTPNTWTASQAEAVQMGGHLVTINDSDENQWVFDTFSRTGQYGLWIGLNDGANEGSFVWSNGETVQFTDWASDKSGPHR